MAYLSRYSLLRSRERKRGKNLIKKILLLLLFVGITTDLQATFPPLNAGGGPGRLAKPAVLPNTQLRVHDVGKVWLSVTNFGFFGSQDGAFKDAGGKYLVAPSCNFQEEAISLTSFRELSG
jgi:hypothetical protein